MKKEEDALFNMRSELSEYILKHYKTTEEFCWDKNLSKATISNFLCNKKDFQVSTLQKIATSLNKKLKIYLE